MKKRDVGAPVTETTTLFQYLAADPARKIINVLFNLIPTPKQKSSGMNRFPVNTESTEKKIVIRMI